MSDYSGKAVWGVFGGTTRGSSHLRSGLPNQDSLGKWAAPGGSVAVLAVSDGHGSASHFRSEIGSKMGVDTAVHALCETPIPVPDGYSQVLAEAISHTWRESVLAHLEAHPFTDQEWSKLPPKDAAQMKAAVLANPPVAYGATLLCVLAAETEILYLQLGDGDILAVDQNGRATRPVPEDTRLIANQTTSLCQTSAAQDFRSKHFRSSEGAPPVLILVSSDGYSNSFQSDEDFLRLGPDYLELLRTYGPEKVEAQLDKILPEASRKGSGDDITLGFIRRMNDDGKPAPVPVPQTAAAVAQPDPPTAQLPSPPAKTEALRAPEGMTSPRVPVDVSAVIAPHAQPEPETMFTGGERAGAASPAAGQKPPPEVNPKQPAAAGKKPAAEAGSKPSPPATARKSAAATRSDAAPSETVLLRRKVFWLKVARAGFLVVALAAAGLAWWRPLWVNNFIHLKEPPPPEAPKPPRAPRGHPDGRTPYDEPRKEAPRTRGRTELRDEMWRWHSCLPHPDAPERCLPPTGASLYV